jgi:hypothetical protein
MGTVQFRGYVKDPVEVTGCEGLPLKSTVCIVESQWSSVTWTGFAGPRILLEISGNPISVFAEKTHLLCILTS